MNINDLYSQAKGIGPWTIEIRRALHRIPEAGFSEFKTQALIKALTSDAVRDFINSSYDGVVVATF